jgi:hypothetical protein
MPVFFQRTGCYADNPVNKMCFGERLACLVLQRGESQVLAWVTELQGDLEHPGEQLMPLGPGRYPYLGKAR